jgi:hypothetical protein
MASKTSKNQLQTLINLSRTEPKNCLKELKFGYLQNKGIKLVERAKLIQNRAQFLEFIP